MSTRGVYGFYIQGRTKVTYNHMDSMPTWLGCNLLNGLAQARIEQLIEAAHMVQRVEADARVPDSEVARYQRRFEHRRLEGEMPGLLYLPVVPEDGITWYDFLRGFQGELTPYLPGVDGRPPLVQHFLDSRASLFDSRDCEYAYIINVDTGVMELYAGDCYNPSAPGRYADNDTLPWDESDYAGVELVDCLELTTICNQHPGWIEAYCADIEAAMRGGAHARAAWRHQRQLDAHLDSACDAPALAPSL